MDITNNNNSLRRVEVVEEDEEEYLLCQIWEREGKEIKIDRDSVADQDSVYEVNIVGKLENAREYGETLESEGSLKEISPGHYEWSPGETSNRIQSFGYDETDPRDGSRPNTTAELETFQDEKIEELLGSAFSGATVEEYRNR